ncbi:MAG: hypothetical protein WC474_03110 [Hydrogenophilaceae bacterium]
MTKIQLDPTKLYGFKILDNVKAGQAEDKTSTKIAAKIGGKPVIKLGSKIGGKAGVKPM